MKKNFLYIFCLLSAFSFWGCSKDGNYPGGTVSSYISMFDLRDIYQGKDIVITKENTFGPDKIAGTVISDHSGGNIPAGLLVLQDSRRLGQLRGIAVALGNEAANYVPGDSVVIKVDGKKLQRVNGILQITGVSASDVTKVASGKIVEPIVVKSNLVIDKPGNYESTLISFTKVGFDPTYPPTETYLGNKTINDGFGNSILHTEATAPFANKVLPYSSNFTGIAFSNEEGKATLWPRSEADIQVLSATPPKVAPLVITGFLVDPLGTDTNYEYVQLRATRDINFTETPFAVVTTNNAGANTPTGFPTAGWATGDLRTYKINLTTGTVLKGEYIYIGAIKKIWGAGSTDISNSKWYGKMYSNVSGDGFGTKTTNLLANSGNVAGIAVFDKIDIEESTLPVDLIFYGGGGQIYTPGPPEKGYRVTNTDYYDEKNPITLVDQPFYAQGSNTGKFAFPPATNFVKLVGTYNRTSGRWTSSRLQTNVVMNAAATVALIEGGVTIED